MKKTRLKFLIVSFIIQSVLLNSYVYACGFFRDIPIFYSRDSGQSQAENGYAGYGDVRQPYIPLKEYVSGNIGVVRPQYGSVYLWIAYRHLMQKPFSSADIDFLLTVNKDERKMRKARDWAKEVSTVLQEAIETPKLYASVNQEGLLGHSNTMMTFENCCDGAFSYALDRLETLRKKHGGDSTTITNWTKAQKKVFENCSASSRHPVLPEALAKDASSEEKHEYAYQVASSYFYAMDYVKSASLFEEIARDSTSPYKDIAVYLIMRSYYRNLIYKHDSPQAEPINAQTPTIEKPKSWYVAWYETMLDYLPFTYRTRTSVEVKENVFVEPEKAFLDAYKKWKPRISPNPYREDIEGLYNAVQMRTDPNAIIKNIGDKLIDPSYPVSKHLLTEFDYLVRARSDELAGSKKLDNEFFEWRRLFRVKNSYKQAYEYWKQNQSSLWLVVVLEKVPADAPELNEVLAAAEKIEKSSPAYMTVSYQRAKLLIGRGNKEKANALIDAMLSEPIALSTKNRFLDLKVAKSYSEFLKNILQMPVDLQDGSLLPFNYKEYEFSKKSELDFDWEHFDAVQKTSVAMLLKAAAQKEFPDWLKENLLMAAFSRSIILGVEKEAITAAQQLQVMQPKLKETLDLYVNEKDLSRRSFIGSLIILRYPKMSIFVNPHSWRASGRGGYLDLNEFDTKSGLRDQWWKNDVLKRCAERPDVNFLSAEDQKAVSYELKALAEKMGDKTDYFCKVAIAWFGQNPKDPLLPEMMHRCIQMSRYNKHYDANSNLESSYMVFKLLHKHFKNNEYAKKTPYHYYNAKKK